MILLYVRPCTHVCPGEKELFEALVAERKAKDTSVSAVSAAKAPSPADSGDPIQVY